MKKKKRKFKKIDKIGKKIIFNLDCHPYKQQCIVCCNGQMKDVVKYMKSLKDLSSGGKETLKMIQDKKEVYFEKIKENCGRLFIELPTGYIMILHHNGGWISTTATVSHEANHLSQYILRNAGIQLTQETEEAYTYLQESILENILRKIY